jgi:hypothetical protein
MVCSQDTNDPIGRGIEQRSTSSQPIYKSHHVTSSLSQLSNAKPRDTVYRPNRRVKSVVDEAKMIRDIEIVPCRV